MNISLIWMIRNMQILHDKPTLKNYSIIFNRFSKHKRTVIEVARVRQILKNVVYSASCKCGELAKLLSLLARIGYVCESNVLAGIFYLGLHIIPHYIYCLSYFVVGERLRKYHVFPWSDTACNCQHWENDDINNTVRFVNF
jgi:hypothetical protein